jgi:hypothetical protein
MTYVVKHEAHVIAPIAFATFEQAKDCLRGTLLLQASTQGPGIMAMLRSAEEDVRTWTEPQAILVGPECYEITDIEN